MKYSIKLLILTGITISTLSLLTSCSLISKESEYAARTQEGNITKEQLYDRMVDKIGQQTLDELITETVLEEKYSIPTKTIDDEVQRLKIEYGNDYHSFLSENNISSESQLRDKIKLDKLIEQVALSQVTVKDSDLKELYKQKKPNTHVSHILVSDETVAKEVKAKIDTGEDFSALAKEYSEDAATSQLGGDIGYLNVGMMDPIFEETVFKLDEGEVSEPVKTALGYEIIKVNQQQKLPSFKEMRPQLQTEYISGKVDQQKVRAEIQKLIDKADLKIDEEKLKNLYNSPKTKEKPAYK